VAEGAQPSVISVLGGTAVVEKEGAEACLLRGAERDQVEDQTGFSPDVGVKRVTKGREPKKKTKSGKKTLNGIKHEHWSDSSQKWKGKGFKKGKGLNTWGGPGVEETLKRSHRRLWGPVRQHGAELRETRKFFRPRTKKGHCEEERGGKFSKPKEKEGRWGKKN